MTVKMIAESAGVSIDTAQRKAKELYPNRVIPKRATVLTQQEGMRVMQEIRKLNMVSELPQNAVALPQNAAAPFIEVMQQMIEQNQKFQIEILKEIKSMKQSETPRLEYIQDYYSIIGYANHKNIRDMTTTEARRLSETAKRLCIETGKIIRKIPDERWGTANSYPVEILEKVFEL